MEKIRERLKELSKYKYSTISGLNEGEKSFLPFLFDDKIVVVATSNLIEKYEEQLKNLGKRVVIFNKKIPLMYSFHENNLQEFRQYFVGLNKVVRDEFDVVLLTPEACFQKLPNKNFIASQNFEIKKNGIFVFDDLVKKIVGLGYIKQEIVSSVGDFAVRGDTIDIFMPSCDFPIRISFFDDEVEKITSFDLLNYSQVEEFDKIELCCNSFFVCQKSDKEKIKNQVKATLQQLDLSPEAMLRISDISSKQLDCLDNDLFDLSSVFFLPFCDYFNASIFDYFDVTTQIIVDEPKLFLDRLSELEDENASMFLDLSVKGELLPKTMEFYLQKKEIVANFKNFHLVALSRLLSQNKLFESDFCLNFICSGTPKYTNHFVELVCDCKNYIKNKKTVVLCCGLPLTLNKVKSFFDDAGVKYCEANSLSEIEDKKINLLRQYLPYSCNFSMEDFVLIGSLNLNNEQILTTFQVENQDRKPKALPKVGEYVVHEIHGVGKCIGIKNMKITTTSRDYIIIEYKDGDLLYLPCENADMLSSFVGNTDPKLNKIGGTEFFKTKQRVKNSIKEMAFDLIKVYSSRLNKKGFKYSKDTYLQTEFENSFPYPYTPDQISAINDIKRDMEDGKIMDRLVCGDVGFGKTEVALVSAFKAIQDGKQVAIICPTTILCEQHYNTALSRMKNFLVDVGVINRFKTKGEQEEILKKLKDGKINLICGTHRLFSDDVKFKDLGLIILDEEQRFGVEDKEKLKNLKKTVDVLSLSATPIPRTLYMSLVGIRDVSYLTTPPTNRKKIRANVIDYSDSLLVECCKKELARDGQVLIVYNKVESITNFYAHVRSLLPEARIGFAHGQMSSRELEKAIYDLYTRQTQILISTVLIENGIDLPFANTLFVVDADKLGLSQLYQLRGRIGRGGMDAYAYFSFAKNKVLTQDSYKRLDAIMEFSDFGSGYKVAMRDLEIRGAGDVLGKLQHGHMQEVGYDLYVKLLNEAVGELRGESQEKIVETKIDISLNAFLPNSYISSNEERINFYTKVSKISNKTDFDRVIFEIESVYGKLPIEAKELCFVGLIKNLAQKLFVKSVKIDDYGGKLIFYPEVMNEKLFNYLQEPSVKFVLSLEKTPIITFSKQRNVEEMQEFVIKNLISMLEIQK